MLWVHQLLSELLQYQEVFSEILESLRTQLDETATAAKPTTTYSYELLVERPALLIPQLNGSHLCLVDLASLELKNVHERDDNGNLYERITLLAEQVSAQTGQLPTHSDWRVALRDGTLTRHPRPLLAHTHATLEIKRPYGDASRNAAVRDGRLDIQVKLDLPKLAFALDAIAVHSVLEVWRDNFLYLPTERYLERLRYQKHQLAELVRLGTRAAESTLHERVTTDSSILIDELSLSWNLRDGSPLIRATAEEVGITVRTTSKASTQFDLELAKLECVDMRPNSPVHPSYRAFITPTPSPSKESERSGEAGHFVMRYTSKPGEAGSVDARLASFTGVAIPALLVHLKAELTPVITDLIRLFRERSTLLAQFEVRDAHETAMPSQPSGNEDAVRDSLYSAHHSSPLVT